MNFHCRVVNFSIFKVRGSRTHFLELRQHKNDSIQLKKLLSLNLPRFFTHLHCEKKSAAISKLATFLTELSPSCIVLALKKLQSRALLPSTHMPKLGNLVCFSLKYHESTKRYADCHSFGLSHITLTHYSTWLKVTS